MNKVVDAGIRSILIPRVESAADVRRAIAATRFEYDGAPGNRGAPLARSTGWQPADGSFPNRVDGSILVGAMIETEPALDAIDDILSVPDLGFAFIGPGDISIALGQPLETDATAVANAVERVMESAAQNDVTLGRIATTPDAIREAVADGFRVIRVGVDTVAVANTIQNRLAAVQANQRDEE